PGSGKEKIEIGKSKGGRKRQPQERWPARCRRYRRKAGGGEDGGGDLREVEAGVYSAGIAGEHWGDCSGGRAQAAETGGAAGHQGRPADAHDGERRKELDRRNGGGGAGAEA